ncbi:LANO_0E12354g1_1 [Lachancea nothofagi CBS 11611]|uniref:LANO_0E12354g1_1 n=1 Tax=Lachancea nothofagi CBS 11611 TaxID=1266666 RepID=A0A1G4JY45_9SACH|nr:LANO_0E12354g1_1 [Lachancea nothofagi CBS 11611]
MAIPQTMKAVVVEGDKAIVKNDVAVPKVFGTQFLVKVKAAAANPTDWKHVDFKIAPQGSILGCDSAGEIVELGPDVDRTRFAVGQTVVGVVHGGSVKFPENGGFAEYALLDSLLSYQLDLTPSKAKHIPEGPVKNFESAASLPVSLLTASAVLDVHLGSKWEWEPKSPQHDFPLLIWGGATGVGQLLIQVAKQIHAYSKIVVVASKKHDSVLKQYGADDTFDYHDSDVIEQLHNKYGGFKHLVDCVSNPGTFEQVYECASSNATIVPLMLFSEDAIPEAKRKQGIKVDPALLYLVSGQEIPFGSVTVPARPEYRTETAKFIKFSEPRLKNGKLHHIPIKISDGIVSVPKIMEDVKQGVNSGEKLVASF